VNYTLDIVEIPLINRNREYLFRWQA
jgi:hypothetical protein